MKRAEQERIGRSRPEAVARTAKVSGRGQKEAVGTLNVSSRGLLIWSFSLFLGASYPSYFENRRLSGVLFYVVC